jgi:ESCRT-I complex subunit TSG101
MQSPPAAPQPPLIVPTPIPDLMDADDSQLPASPAPLAQVMAPPRPPNPELIALHTHLHEKFTTELASLTTSVTQENERHRGAQADLLKGEPAVRDEMARLEAVRDVCQTVRHQLAEVVNSAENVIANLERKGEPEVDELVCATNIVHNQYVQTVHLRLEN